MGITQCGLFVRFDISIMIWHEGNYATSIPFIYAVLAQLNRVSQQQTHIICLCFFFEKWQNIVYSERYLPHIKLLMFQTSLRYSLNNNMIKGEIHFINSHWHKITKPVPIPTRWIRKISPIFCFLHKESDHRTALRPSIFKPLLVYSSRVLAVPMVSFTVEKRLADYTPIVHVLKRFHLLHIWDKVSWNRIKELNLW